MNEGSKELLSLSMIQVFARGIGLAKCDGRDHIYYGNGEISICIAHNSLVKLNVRKSITVPSRIYSNMRSIYLRF